VDKAGAGGKNQKCQGREEKRFSVMLAGAKGESGVTGGRIHERRKEATEERGGGGRP